MTPQKTPKNAQKRPSAAPRTPRKPAFLAKMAIFGHFLKRVSWAISEHAQKRSKPCPDAGFWVKNDPILVKIGQKWGFPALLNNNKFGGIRQKCCRSRMQISPNFGPNFGKNHVFRGFLGKGQKHGFCSVFGSKTLKNRHFWPEATQRMRSYIALFRAKLGSAAEDESHSETRRIEILRWLRRVLWP